MSLPLRAPECVRVCACAMFLSALCLCACGWIVLVCLCGMEHPQALKRGHSIFLGGGVSGVRGATHLPYDKEDERGAQHQGEHVAEGREGERHGCASQPDDGGGLRGQKGTSSPFALCLWVQQSPARLSLLLLEVIVCFQPAPLRSPLPRPPTTPA